MELRGEVAEAVLDQFPLNVAILDSDGVIQWVNRSWREFGTDNGLALPDGGVGQPYLPDERGPQDMFASHAYDGVSKVLEGSEAMFSMEYPCHGPDELRWFRMFVAGVELEGGRHCLVSHEQITDEKLAELATEAQREQAAMLTQMLLHDMRNAVATAGGWLTHLFPDDDDRERLSPVLSALTRIEQTVGESHELLRLAESRPDYQRVGSDELARTAWDRLTPEDASLTVADTFPVLCYREETIVLLATLFRNAVEHHDATTVRLSRGDREFYLDDNREQALPDAPGSLFQQSTVRHDGRLEPGLQLVDPLAVMHGWTTSLSPGPTGGWRFTIRTEQVHA